MRRRRPAGAWAGRTIGIIAVLLSAVAVTPQSSGQGLPTTPVAFSGRTAPGTGATYSRFQTVSINPSGETLFGAALAGADVTDANDTAVFTGAPLAGGPRLLAREGKLIRGAPGVTLGDVLSTGPINADGLGLFRAGLRGATASPAVLVGEPGTVKVVPGLGGDVTIVGEPVLGTGPRAAFREHSGADLLYWDGTSTSALATPQYAYQPTINSSGRLVFGGGSYDAAYEGMPGAFRTFAATGAPAPGAGAGHVFDLIPGATQNDAGDVAINAWAAPPPGGSRLGGVWAGKPDDLRLVALDGQAAAGLPGHRYDQLLFDIDTPTLVPLAGDGRVAFTGGYVDESGQLAGYGAWAGRPGDVRLLAKRGMELALPSGGTATLNHIRHNGIWLNAAGQAVLLGDSTVPDSPSLRDTLLAVDGDGTVHLIAREGSPFKLTPGGFATVSQIFVGSGEGTGGEDGRATALSETGHLVYTLQFDDGTSAVVLTAVPEPAGLVAAVTFGAGTLALRRRRARTTAVTPSPPGSCSGRPRRSEDVIRSGVSTRTGSL